MKKEEFQQKVEEGLGLIGKNEYAQAVEVFDEMPLDSLRDPRALQQIAKAYEKCRRYADAQDVLAQAHKCAPRSRGPLFHLCTVSIKGGDLSAAMKYYNEFCQIAKYDNERYILQYRIAQAEGQDDDALIKILENFNDAEPDDRWMYELAKLYTTNNRIDDALEACDQITLWFSSGKYVQLAKELKSYLTGVPLPEEERGSYEDDMTGEATADAPMSVDTEEPEIKTVTAIPTDVEDQAEEKNFKPYQAEDESFSEAKLPDWSEMPIAEESGSLYAQSAPMGEEPQEEKDSFEKDFVMDFVPDASVFADAKEEPEEVDFRKPSELEVREIEETKLPEGEQKLEEAIKEEFPTFSWEEEKTQEPKMASVNVGQFTLSAAEIAQAEAIRAAQKARQEELRRAEINRAEVLRKAEAMRAVGRPDGTVPGMQERSEEAQRKADLRLLNEAKFAEQFIENETKIDFTKEMNPETEEKTFEEPTKSEEAAALEKEELPFDDTEGAIKVIPTDRARTEMEIPEWLKSQRAEAERLKEEIERQKEELRALEEKKSLEEERKKAEEEARLEAEKKAAEEEAAHQAELEQKEREARLAAEKAEAAVNPDEWSHKTFSGNEEMINFSIIGDTLKKAEEDDESVVFFDSSIFGKKEEKVKDTSLFAEEDEPVVIQEAQRPREEAPKPVVKEEAPKPVVQEKVPAPVIIEEEKTAAEEPKSVVISEAVQELLKGKTEEDFDDDEPLTDANLLTPPSHEMGALEELEIAIAEKKASSEKLGQLPIEPEINEKTWHFIVYGENEAETLERAQELLKEFSERVENCPKRMLKTNATRIANANIIESLDHFLGSMVIIQNAAGLSDQQLSDFTKVLEKDDNSLLIVFTDTMAHFEKMFARKPELGGCFTAAFEGRAITPRDLVDTAKEYLYYQQALMTKEAEGVCYEYARKLLAGKKGFYRSEIREFAEIALNAAEHTGLFGLFTGAVDKDGFMHVTDKFFKKAEEKR